jgi:PncC family amidohydrolase
MKFWIDKDGFIYLFQALKASGAIAEYREVTLAIKHGQVSVNDETCFKQRHVLKGGDTLRYKRLHLIISERDELGRTDEEILRETKPEGNVRHGQTHAWESKPLKSEIQIDKELEQTSWQLHEKLLINKQTISIAESCTGGLVQEIITNQSGASAYFVGGIVSYSDYIKVKVLKVNVITIEKFGAVSKEVAIEMAQSGSKLFATDICGAITGIAGPSGGTKEKPVGLVHIAVCVNSKVLHQQFNFSGDRELIRKKSATGLFKMILANL